MKILVCRTHRGIHRYYIPDEFLKTLDKGYFLEYSSHLQIYYYGCQLQTIMLDSYLAYSLIDVPLVITKSAFYEIRERCSSCHYNGHEFGCLKTCISIENNICMTYRKHLSFWQKLHKIHKGGI